jgi:ABC-type transport system substrate-binding protein
MKLIAIALVSVVLATACSGATAAPPATTPAAAPEAPLLANEGGVLRPIDNGGRVAMHDGYATVRLSPSPQSMDPLLQVWVFDSAGQAQEADVTVDYDSLDMDHGVSTAHGTLHEGCYRMGLSFGMAGSWRLVIHVTRAGAEEKMVLMLPWVGL